MTKQRYPHGSDEDLEIIRLNECEAADGSLRTTRFQGLWNEIERLRAALQQLVDGISVPVYTHHRNKWVEVQISPEDIQQARDALKERAVRTVGATPMKIIKREVEDDLEAYKMAEFIEQAGGSVFSITYNGRAQHQGALADHSRFIVWGKYESVVLPDLVDKNFGNWLNSLTPQR